MSFWNEYNQAGENACVRCGVAMGAANDRQLCGKTVCHGWRPPIGGQLHPFRVESKDPAPYDPITQEMVDAVVVLPRQNPGNGEK